MTKRSIPYRHDNTQEYSRCSVMLRGGVVHAWVPETVCLAKNRHDNTQGHSHCSVIPLCGAFIGAGDGVSCQECPRPRRVCGVGVRRRCVQSRSDSCEGTAFKGVWLRRGMFVEGAWLVGGRDWPVTCAIGVVCCTADPVCDSPCAIYVQQELTCFARKFLRAD